MSDVLIVGGAGTGWATAHHLLKIDPDLTVRVLERDPSLTRSSTMLSDGNVRVQFNLDENILMSKYGLECIDNFAEELDIGANAPALENHRTGNLFLVDEEGREAAMAGISNQNRLGCQTSWLDMEEIAGRFPAARSEHLVGGTWGPDDGPTDPSAVVAGYKRSATKRGAEALVGEAQELVVEDGKAVGVVVNGERLEAGNLVVAAGAWSAGLLATVSIDIPVEPVMRTVYVVAGAVEGAEGLPHMFLPTGPYMIPEKGEAFMMAWSSDDDPVGFDFTPSPRSRFYDVIWPEIATYLPAFDRLEVVRSWAGLYAQNRLDANAIIGEWPNCASLYVATGFSGHGFQHCHAMGRHLAELITGNEPSIDLSRFGPQRIIDNEPYVEHAGRII